MSTSIAEDYAAIRAGLDKIEAEKRQPVPILDPRLVTFSPEIDAVLDLWFGDKP